MIGTFRARSSLHNVSNVRFSSPFSNRETYCGEQPTSSANCRCEICKSSKDIATTMAIFREYRSQSRFAFRHSAFSSHLDGSGEECSSKNAICSSGVFILLSFFLDKIRKTIVINDIVSDQILAHFLQFHKFFERVFPLFHRPSQFNGTTCNNIYPRV